MIDWSAFTFGSHRIGCPSCQRNKRDKTMGVTINQNGSGVAHCFRCGIVQTSQANKSTFRPVQAAQERRRHTTLSDYGWMLWSACKPISGVAEAYLKARECVIPPVDGHLRWHPALEHKPSGYVGAAMVALVTDTLTAAPLTLHRTWITASGDKAKIDPPRMLLGNHTSDGGVIRLWSDDCVTAGLGIAEGIETALTLAHGYEPVWATIDAGHLKKFPVIPSVEHLLIAVDRDEAGIDAAQACATRWVSAGRTVQLTTQATNDLNDLREVA